MREISQEDECVFSPEHSVNITAATMKRGRIKVLSIFDKNLSAFVSCGTGISLLEGAIQF